MNRKPTYTAEQIKQLCLNSMLLQDFEAIKVLVELIDEEINLYSEEDLIILMNASMILFTRTLLMGSIKNLK